MFPTQPQVQGQVRREAHVVHRVCVVFAQAVEGNEVAVPLLEIGHVPAHEVLPALIARGGAHGASGGKGPPSAGIIVRQIVQVLPPEIDTGLHDVPPLHVGQVVNVLVIGLIAVDRKTARAP